MRMRGVAVLVVLGHVALAGAALWWWRPERATGPVRVPEVGGEGRA
jgi:hypothetical protein